MRYLLALLAVLGIIVSSLALRVHYSHDVEPCDINAKWDCGVVNHSRFAMVGPVPVAAVGIVGYAVLAGLALARRRGLLLLAAVPGLAYALYLTHIERDLLEVWCLYCVCSQVLIALLTLGSAGWLLVGQRGGAAVRAHASES
jgi:vitamin-K-epoxide reductase (warfarin-sensitive)